MNAKVEKKAVKNTNKAHISTGKLPGHAKPLLFLHLNCLTETNELELLKCIYTCIM